MSNTTGVFEEELKVDNSAKHAVSFLVNESDHPTLKNAAMANRYSPIPPSLAEHQTVKKCSE